jgi:hypothetical protein
LSSSFSTKEDFNSSTALVILDDFFALDFLIESCAKASEGSNNSIKIKPIYNDTRRIFKSLIQQCKVNQLKRQIQIVSPSQKPVSPFVEKWNCISE